MGVRIGLALALTLGVASGAPTLATAEERSVPVTAETELPLVAEHDNGIREALLVRYVGYSEAKQWRKGQENEVKERGSKIKVHSPNTLKCGWKVEAWVERRAYYVLQSGIEAPIPGFEKTIPVAKGSSRADKGFLGRLFSDDERCVEGAEAFTAEAEKAKAALGQGFEAFVRDDWAAAQTDLQALVKAERIVAR